MRQSYRAILKGDLLEWTDSAPPDLVPEQPVEVTILDATNHTDTNTQTTQGQRMAQALARLAESDALSQIDDPVKWQKEIRQDRPLPGRD